MNLNENQVFPHSPLLFVFTLIMSSQTITGTVLMKQRTSDWAQVLQKVLATVRVLMKMESLH